MGLNVKKIAELFEAVKNAARNEVVDKEIWRDFISRVETLPKSANRIGLYSLLRMALLSEGTRRVVREVMLELYEERARGGDEEAASILASFASMVSDWELLGRFIEEPPSDKLASRSLRRVIYNSSDDGHTQL